MSEPQATTERRTESKMEGQPDTAKIERPLQILMLLVLLRIAIAVGISLGGWCLLGWRSMMQMPGPFLPIGEMIICSICALFSLGIGFLPGKGRIYSAALATELALAVGFHLGSRHA